MSEPRHGRRRSASAVLLALAPAVMLLTTGAVVGGMAGWDALRRPAARRAALRDWRALQPLMVRTLHQEGALEYGEVWRTHGGVICGTVDGKASFSGLTSMTPFFVRGGRPVFLANTAFDAFMSVWRDCVADPWIVVRPGSQKAGYCATRRGAAKCVRRLYFD